MQHFESQPYGTPAQLLAYQQQQIELQLQQMKLANLELQKRLFMDQHPPIPQPTYGLPNANRHGQSFGVAHLTVRHELSDSDLAVQQRRGALESLHQAQQGRDPVHQGFNDNTVGQLGVRQPNLWQTRRLCSDPSTPSTGRISPGEGKVTPQLEAARAKAAAGHQRNNSVTLCGSQVFGSPKAAKNDSLPVIKPLQIRHEKGRSVSSDNSATSDSSVRSDTSGEAVSFESNGTSVEASPVDISLPKSDKALNPASPTFNPAAPAFMPTWNAGAARHQFRSVSAPVITAQTSGSSTPVVQVLRQPRGPAPEAELANKNFAGRIRRRAIASLSGRINSPIIPEFPQFE